MLGISCISKSETTVSITQGQPPLFLCETHEKEKFLAQWQYLVDPGYIQWSLAGIRKSKSTIHYILIIPEEPLLLCLVLVALVCELTTPGPSQLR